MAESGASSAAPAPLPPEIPARVQVLLPLPLGGAYDYRLDPGEVLLPGDIVRVPLGARTVTGVVWGAGTDEVADEKLKPILHRYDCPPLPQDLRRLINWIADYTIAEKGAVLRMALRVPSALEPPPPRIAYKQTGALPERLTPARRRVLAVLEGGPPRGMAELAREAGVSGSVVKGLAEAGALVPVQLSGVPRVPLPDPARSGIALSPDQAEAGEQLRARIGGGFSATLLDGVTGAGKTEVYFEAIAAAIGAGKQALVLLPEIALTAQWLYRFEARFGARPIEWHSDIQQTRRRQGWRAVAGGQARVVVGARSALFLPFPELGLIVVDEEHDGAFKQEDGVIYNARDMAVVRAKLAEIPIVLASATPSLETAVNVGSGRYQLAQLPARHGAADMPEVSLVDMRATPPPRGRWLSDELVEGIERALAINEQSLLFLNRRGYAPLTLCRACGHRLDCPHCSAWLVEHRLAARLQCHHCGFLTQLPPECPACGALDRFAACGPGVERLAEETVERFPEARIAIMASDTVTSPRAAQDLIERMTRHEIDILIGTQIVAKGHHFPLLTLIGVVDADLGLAGGDLRAAERTYQLLHQVSGRAGRAERPGRVLVQSYMPEHPVMEALVSGDRDQFLQREADARRAQGMPPFGRLAALIVSGPTDAQVRETARSLGGCAPHGPGIRVLGPAPAPFALLRGRWRQRLLLKTARAVNIQFVLRKWLDQVKVPNAVRVQVDVDPYSFL